MANFEEARGEKSPPASRRILIVEDHVDSAMMLELFLSSLGYEPLVAHDAGAALRILGDTTVVAGILDIGLADMDGYALATEVVLRLGERSPPLIALTGYTDAAERERARAHGFRALIGKPADLDALARALQEVLLQR